MWWRERLHPSYSKPERFYHNADAMFLAHKLPFLKDKDLAIALASLFQYLEYKPKTDLSEENCSLFREFAVQAGLSANQVSRATEDDSFKGVAHRALPHFLTENVGVERSSIVGCATI